MLHSESEPQSTELIWIQGPILNDGEAMICIQIPVAQLESQVWEERKTADFPSSVQKEGSETEPILTYFVAGPKAYILMSAPIWVATLDRARHF